MTHLKTMAYLILTLFTWVVQITFLSVILAYLKDQDLPWEAYWGRLDASVAFALVGVMLVASVNELRRIAQYACDIVEFLRSYGKYEEDGTRTRPLPVRVLAVGVAALAIVVQVALLVLFLLVSALQTPLDPNQPPPPTRASRALTVAQRASMSFAWCLPKALSTSSSSSSQCAVNVSIIMLSMSTMNNKTMEFASMFQVPPGYVSPTQDWEAGCKLPIPRNLPPARQVHTHRTPPFLMCRSSFCQLPAPMRS